MIKIIGIWAFALLTFSPQVIANIELKKSHQLSINQMDTILQQELSAFYTKNPSQCLKQNIDIVFKSSCVQSEPKSSVSELFILYLFKTMMATMPSTAVDAQGDQVLEFQLRLKNALSLQYVHAVFSEEIKSKNVADAFDRALNNLKIFIGENGLWQNPTQVVFKFQDSFIARPIDPILKNKQTLMTYISNGYTDPILYYGYVIMKNAIQTHLAKQYRNVYYYLDSNHPLDLTLSLEDRFNSTLLELENNPTLDHIDFYWQAHSSDIPMNGANNLSQGKISKLRFVNNTWCDGVYDFNNFDSYIPANAKYVMASRGINNPFPFNFALNFFLGFNLPVELSESLARVIHLRFYQNVLSQLEFGPYKKYSWGPLEDGQYVLKSVLYLYSSWFDHFGDGNFSLSDPLFPTSDKDKNILYSDSSWPTYNEATEKLGSSTTPPTTTASSPKSKFSPMQRLLTDKVLAIAEGAKDIKENNFNKIITATGLDALNFISTLFIERKKQKDLFGDWNNYRLTDSSIQDFKQMAQFYVNDSNPYFAFVSYLITNASGINFSINKSMDQLIFNIKFTKELRGKSKLLSDNTAGILTGIEIGKDVQIIVSFKGSDRISLLPRGINVNGPYVNRITMPEIIIDHQKGNLQLLQEGLPIIKIM